MIILNEATTTPVTKYVSFLFFFVTAVAPLAFGEKSSESSTYIVHAEEPGTGRLTFNERKQWCASFLARTTGAKESRLLYVYEHVIHGFAARLTKAEVEALRKADGFVEAVPDALLRLHTTYSPQFVGLDPGKGLWPKTEYGKGIIIGVLDTGVWPESASFSDQGIPPPPPRWKGFCETAPDFNSSNCNNKLIGARVFGRGNRNVDKSPRDSVAGHGTHTASTAAGNSVADAEIYGYATGTARGMAPNAHIAIYKVCFGETGSCATSDILAGMDQAIADGVDVLSLSIASLYLPLYINAIAIGAFRAIEKGIFVTCSAGNDGPTYSSVANDAPWIMTVGASTVDREFVANVNLGNGQILPGESLYPGRGLEMKELLLVYGGGDGLCDNGSLDPRLVKGNLVVCKRRFTDGISDDILKGQVVKDAGSAGMILVNDEASWDIITADAHVLPATTVGFDAGVTLAAYVNSTKTPTAAFQFEGTVFGISSAPSVARFSSRGPSGNSPGTLKPDVIAPGVAVLAAWPSNLSPSRLRQDKRRVKFNTLSGTSMACPHVSGVAALLKSAHPDWSPAAIKSALMTTADLLDKKGRPILDSATNETADVLATGAGHVNMEKASDPGLIYDIGAEDYILYLCSLKYTASQIRVFVTKNVSCPSDPETTLSENLNYPSVVLNVRALPMSTTLKRSVTNVGPAKLTYSVNIVPPNGVEVIVSPRSLSFTAVMEKKSYNVTFKVKSRPKDSGSYSQGFITWVSCSSDYHYQVRSPIFVSWNEGNSV